MASMVVIVSLVVSMVIIAALMDMTTYSGDLTVHRHEVKANQSLKTQKKEELACLWTIIEKLKLSVYGHILFNRM